MFFWNSLAFYIIQWLLAIWSLVPLAFVSPTWIFGSSRFMVHILLKPCLENFEHYFDSMWDECNCVVVWTFFGIAFFGIGMKTDLFQSCGHCWVFQICWHIECSTLTASSLRIGNSSAGIPSPSLALFIVVLPKAHLTSHSRISALGEWLHHCRYLGQENVMLCPRNYVTYLSPQNLEAICKKKWKNKG